jgi:hypothetical protein
MKGNAMADEKPKIIVDDDWKAQAQAEKEKLEHEAGAAAEPELPAASFATLISSLVAQAYMAMGGYEDPKTKRRYVDLALAKHHIDTLAMLEDKTRSNLTPDEKKLLDNALYETRMQYVQLAQRMG